MVAGGRLGAQATVGASLVRGVVRRFQDREAAHQSIVNRHQGSRVVKFTAVVRRAEDSHELSITEELISIFDDLMRSANQINIIFLKEALNYGLSKCVRDTAIIFSPAGLALLGVTPKQIAEEAVLRNLCGSSDLLELRNGDELGGKATVHAQDFIVN